MRRSGKQKSYLRRIRFALGKKLGMKTQKGQARILSQREAAKMLGLNPRTWEAWEAERIQMGALPKKWLEMELTKHGIDLG